MYQINITWFSTHSKPLAVALGRNFGRLSTTVVTISTVDSAKASVGITCTKRMEIMHSTQIVHASSNGYTLYP